MGRDLDRFGALPLIVPDRRDHIEAAELRSQCRRHGIQIDTIDALRGQLCTRHGLIMLTADKDFHRMARLTELQLWQA